MRREKRTRTSNPPYSPGGGQSCRTRQDKGGAVEQHRFPQDRGGRKRLDRGCAAVSATTAGPVGRQDGTPCQNAPVLTAFKGRPAQACRRPGPGTARFAKRPARRERRLSTGGTLRQRITAWPLSSGSNRIASTAARTDSAPATSDEIGNPRADMPSPKPTCR